MVWRQHHHPIRLIARLPKGLASFDAHRLCKVILRQHDSVTLLIIAAYDHGLVPYLGPMVAVNGGVIIVHT